MSYLLHIETSTTSCSVALSDQAQVIHQVAYDNGYSHAENLHPFIQRVLNESGIQIKDVAAVAVSKGPGSYTGLRIGVSAAKGLAYSLGIPLIGVDTLQAMAVAAKKLNPNVAFYCPMIDARRMEVYTAVFDQTLNAVVDTNAMIIDEQGVKSFERFENICFFGNGYAKAVKDLETLPGVQFVHGIVPQAADMAVLAAKKFEQKQFEDLAYFEPFYLKDFLILKKKDNDK